MTINLVYEEITCVNDTFYPGEGGITDRRLAGTNNTEIQTIVATCIVYTLETYQ